MSDAPAEAEAVELKCPRDGAVLRTERYEAEIEVDVCASCKGMWLDKGELEAIEETSERDYSNELAAESAVAPQSADYLAAEARRGPIACPKCAGEMASREYGYNSQIIIDTCVAGCGVWLDEGEIQALEKFFERNRDNDTLPFHWRLWASVLSVFHKR